MGEMLANARTLSGRAKKAVRLLCWLAKSIGLQAAGLLTLLFFQLLN
jgi:hypothetical protein